MRTFWRLKEEKDGLFGPTSADYNDATQIDALMCGLLLCSGKINMRIGFMLKNITDREDLDPFDFLGSFGGCKGINPNQRAKIFIFTRQVAL